MKFSTFVAGLVATNFMLFQSASHARDYSCDALGLTEDALQDGIILARTEAGWTRFTSVSDLNLSAPRNQKFVYVIRPIFGTDRRGILVIKSNRTAASGDNEEMTQKILLVRKDVTSDEGCDRVPDFPRDGMKIPTKAYEDFHDYPARDPASVRAVENVIKRFHFAYRSDAQRRCVRTDDNRQDSWPWNRNSNRAQFSFNQQVVESGILREWRVFFPVPSPFEGTADNRTRDGEI